ncbi:hypothetical protein PPACK8108_LOCUS56 [Phakopsora pachyrhizi]|uniref:Uncharacterized protein n=1 Tax=Phakopsora pachyrhizi TaxID=170000 RepID=A0AAV0ACP5_PHAPC|nr:hypothetical protein PPACK8108_LOCUS56 [Phakopsora pachyrhizi]
MSQSPIPPKQSEFSTPTSKSSIMNTQSKKRDDEPVATSFSGKNKQTLLSSPIENIFLNKDKKSGFVEKKIERKTGKSGESSEAHSSAEESWKDPSGEISESSSIELLTVAERYQEEDDEENKVKGKGRENNVDEQSSSPEIYSSPLARFSSNELKMTDSSQSESNREIAEQVQKDKVKFNLKPLGASGLFLKNRSKYTSSPQPQSSLMMIDDNDRPRTIQKPSSQQIESANEASSPARDQGSSSNINKSEDDSPVSEYERETGMRQRKGLKKKSNDKSKRQSKNQQLKQINGELPENVTGMRTVVQLTTSYEEKQTGRDG